MRILVIDDNPDHRELVRARVRKAYPDAEIVEIIRQSMLDEKLSEGQPDLALTDYRLHWSDGLQVLEQIKHMYPETPVIMVTDTGSEEIAAAGMKGGLSDYILKDHLQRLPIAIRESLEKIKLRQRAETERAQLIREQAARAEAEAGERRYRSLAEAIPQIVWTADAGGRFDYYNRRWFEYSGLGENESFEHDAWKHILHEEDAEATLTRWRGAVQSGEGYEIECRFRRASDGAFRWHLCRAIPVRNPDGGITKWFGTCTDIDDQKRSAESMREAQKLESIGLLAGGVAHDFNNLLTGILGNASLVLEMVPVGDAVHPLLENVVVASERAADLTQQLLAYSGRGRYFVEPVDLSQLVREIGTLIQSSIPKKVSVRLNLADDLPYAEVDPTQIRQLVMNLVINGAEAIGEDRVGIVTVSTFFQPVDEVYLASVEFSLNGIGPGDYIAVRVADDGCGMDESVRQHIFDPFFTTKFTGRGLGLAAALGIVRGHHGAIRIQSAPGRGSVFEVLIPSTGAGNAREPKKEDPSSNELRGEGAILVIDDEEIVRKSAKSALERYGYEVLLANDGLEGVRAFSKYRRRTKAVLLDMMMPVMGGEEALQELRAISPLTPVIGSSGYSEALAMRYFGDKGLAGFLQKPYTPQALAEYVQRAVEGRVRSQAG